MIKVEKVRKYYGKNRGVEEVSFEIKEGEIYGLIGPNGAGKTTVIRVLTGFLNMGSGSVFLAGRKIPEKINEIKENVGYLPGEINYYPNMRVKEFLDYNRKFYTGIDREFENRLIELLDIDLFKKFKELSLGNKKKVGILQTLVHKPKILILDEPTNGLDPLLQQKLYSLLKEEKERGCAILFSSHVLSEVEKICDRVGIMKDGIIVKEAFIDEISRYSRKNVSVYGLEDKENLTKNFMVISEENGNTSFSIPLEKIKSFINDLNGRSLSSRPF